MASGAVACLLISCPCKPSTMTNRVSVACGPCNLVNSKLQHNMYNETLPELIHPRKFKQLCARNGSDVLLTLGRTA